MTALTDKRQVLRAALNTLTLEAKAEEVFQGGIAAIDRTGGADTGKVRKYTGAAGLLPVGLFSKGKTVASGGSVSVDLFQEVRAIWLENSAGGDQFSAPGDIGALAYAVDDQTVAKTSNGGARSVFGRVWGVDASKGVLVEPFDEAVDALAQLEGTGSQEVEMLSFAESDGTPLAAFADGASSTPGIDLANNEAFGIRWNDNATLDPIATAVRLPDDLDSSADVVVKMLVSTTGDTDTPTIGVGAFFQTVGAAHDADADAGGTSGAVSGAAKVVEELSVTISAADVPDPPAMLTLTLSPTDGTLGTDDLIVHGVRLEYTRKV